MSKTKLKKYLQTLPQEYLVQIVLDLYDARKEAKDYLEFFMNPDPEIALEKAKKAVYRNYFTPQSRTRAKVSVKSANDIISDFIKLDISSEPVADLHLYHLEVMMTRLVLRHITRETAWNSVVVTFRKAIDHIIAYDLKSRYERRIEKILDYARHSPSYLRVRERMDIELQEADH